MLDRPRQPIDDVGVDVFVAPGKPFVEVSTHQPPSAPLGLDAPPGPQIELVVDDRRAARFKHDTEILSPLSMSKPPLTKLHKFLAGVNEPVHVERAEIV